MYRFRYEQTKQLDCIVSNMVESSDLELQKVFNKKDMINYKDVFDDVMMNPYKEENERHNIYTAVTIKQ